MPSNFSDEYQYNSCTSRGICSINPKTSSLQEILVVYLSVSAHYILELLKMGYENSELKNLILNTISILVSNPEFSEKDFQIAENTFKTELPELIKKYEEVCNENNIKPKILKTDFEYEKETNIITSIRKGEKLHLFRLQKLSDSVRNLYKILFIILKSMCINVLTLSSYEKKNNDGYNLILEILDSIDKKDNEEIVSSLIKKASETDNKLMLELINTIEECYGKTDSVTVSYTTTPSKAVMVVGSNLKELENILEKLKDQDIDVYTHDEMILAHTYPKFQEYKNLKGQFGQGYENCLLDFSTFPGPIILTRHSLFNVEHLYRGRLFTTDCLYSKGVIKIENNDFSKVIESAKEAKGFKSGKECKSEIIGYNINDIKKSFAEAINNNSFSHIFIIEPYDSETKEYIENLLTKIPENVLVITLFPHQNADNIISINACFNTFGIIHILSEIQDFISSNNLKTTIFIPKCDRYTVSKIIYLSSIKEFSVYLGKCSPMILNPALITKLKENFNINTFSTVKQDLNKIK